MAEQGKKIIAGISAYLLVKGVLNCLLGARLSTMILPVLLTAALFLNLWEYTGYAAAAVLALVALRYLPDNLHGLPGTWLYLTEGILDFGVAAVLVLSKDIKAYFDQGQSQ